MKIAASSVNLSSSHERITQKAQGTDRAFGLSASVSTYSKDSRQEILKDTFAKSDESLDLLGSDSDGLYMKPGTYRDITVKEPEETAQNSGLSSIDMIHVHLLRILLQMAQNMGGKEWSGFARNISMQLDGILGGNYDLFQNSNSYSLSSYEKEATSFQGYGRALTQDGRVIDFNVSFGMSREFREYSHINIDAMSKFLIDPLVINVGSDVTNISDQSFYFDLDADGQKENVRMLGRGSGFLAMDKDGDGIINDGSELFGTRTGDGFGELREYDEDGNGWIDENDVNTWSALKVWIKDSSGKDQLLTLKEADVGAIYLGEVSTEFTEYSDMTLASKVNGQVRSTGIFLHESSNLAGTVQHVDLAYS